jgi:hypothetical protein
MRRLWPTEGCSAKKKLITVLKTAPNCIMEFLDIESTCHISAVSERLSSIMFLRLRK